MHKLFNHPKFLIPMISMDNDVKRDQHHVGKKQLAWHTWNKSMKISKNNLLNDDLNDIDPIVQRHMTIASTTASAMNCKDTMEHKQCHRLRQDPNLTITSNKIKETYSLRIIHRNHSLKLFSSLTGSKTSQRRLSNHLHNRNSSSLVSDHDYWRIPWKEFAYNRSKKPSDVT